MGSIYRKFLLFVMFLAFAITVPMVLLSTAGYRFNALNRRIEKTGIIEVQSQPSGARIFLNGEVQASTTPTSIRRLLPEDYDIRISLHGYLDWAKKLSVDSGRTTFTSRVILLRDSLPSIVESGKYTNATWNQDGIRMAAIREEQGWQELIVWNRASKLTEVLSRNADDDIIGNEILWSPDGQKILHLQHSAEDTTAVVHAPGTARAPWTATQSLPKGPYRAKWSSDSQSVLFIGPTGAFLMTSTGNAAKPLAIGKDVLDASARDGQALILKRGENEKGEVILEKMDRTNGSAKTIAVLPNGITKIYEWRGNIAAVSDDRLNQLTFIDTVTSDKMTTEGNQMKRWRDGDTFVSWSNFEIRVGNLSTGESEVITRLAEKIVGCDWHPSGTVVICATDNRIFASETDSRDGRNTWTLANGENIGGLSVDETNNKLYFIATIGQSKGIFERSY